MRLEHPLAGDGDGVAPSAVDVNGESVAVGDDGTFEAPQAWAARFAAAYDVEVEEIAVGDERPATQDQDHEASAEYIDDGECPWCDEYSGDGVPQHAGSAHPERWQRFKAATEG